MITDVLPFADWLARAQVREAVLTPRQRHLLEVAFEFLQRCGRDYYSVRLLSHFLLHCHSGLKVAQIARLLGISRAAASAQQGLSSKEVVQAAHHRLAGRGHGKLLPRFAGPIAHFLVDNPKASRYDLLDFIERTWGVRVCRMALYHFLKKYGLDQAGRIVPLPKLDPPTGLTSADAAWPPTPLTGAEAGGIEALPRASTSKMPPQTDGPVPLPAPEFFLPRPSMPAPFSSCPKPSTGSPRRKAASRTTTAPCGADC